MKEMLDTGKTQAEVAELLGVSANTISREVRKNGQENHHQKPT